MKLTIARQYWHILFAIPLVVFLLLLVPSQVYGVATCTLHCDEAILGCQDGDGAAVEINAESAFSNREVFIADTYVDIYGSSQQNSLYTTLNADGYGVRNLGILERSRNGHSIAVCARGSGINQICTSSSSDLLCNPYVASAITPTGTGPAPYDPRCGPDSDRNSAVKTALGCLPTSPQAFVDIAIPWAIGLGSGVAFLLGLYGVLMIVISAGNPEKMQAGKEMITSAITGLLIIIFAVMILKIVGVDILRLFYWDSGGVDSSFL